MLIVYQQRQAHEKIENIKLKVLEEKKKVKEQQILQEAKRIKRQEKEAR